MVIGFAFVLMTFIMNKGMNYSATNAAQNRSRQMETGILNNEKKYIIFASHIQNTIQKIMFKIYFVLILLSIGFLG